MPMAVDTTRATRIRAGGTTARGVGRCVGWLGFAAAGTRTSAAMKTAARQRANNILNSDFVQNPGFNV